MRLGSGDRDHGFSVNRERLCHGLRHRAPECIWVEHVQRLRDSICRMRGVTEKAVSLPLYAVDRKIGKKPHGHGRLPSNSPFEEMKIHVHQSVCKLNDIMG